MSVREYNLIYITMHNRSELTENFWKCNLSVTEHTKPSSYDFNSSAHVLIYSADKKETEILLEGFTWQFASLTFGTTTVANLVPYVKQQTAPLTSARYIFGVSFILSSGVTCWLTKCCLLPPAVVCWTWCSDSLVPCIRAVCLRYHVDQ